MKLIKAVYLSSLLLIPTVSLAENNTLEISKQLQANVADLKFNELERYQLALDYMLGKNGVERSAEKAANIFQQLAEQGWNSAQHMLANLYLKGKGVERSDIEAYKWLTLAARASINVSDATQYRRDTLYQRLQHRLSPEAMTQIMHDIDNWQPRMQQTSRS